MDNTTTLIYTMTHYRALENYKHGLFAVFFLLYFLTVALNSLLISIIHQNKELHRPMNAFTCLLSINEIYGSTALLPAVMALLLSDTYEVSVKWCKAQVYFLHSYATAEFCILAVMGYDRYAAICFPLHYNSIMSHSKTRRLVVFAALYPLIVFLCFYVLTIRLSICGKVMPRVNCVNMEVVKTSCTDVPYISIVGLALMFFTVIPQVIMILFSYAQIARECRKLSRQSQRNALKTCIPHVLSLLNYTVGACFEIIQGRSDMSHFSIQLRIFMSLYFIIMPAVSNPVLYGLGTQTVRVCILRLFVRYKILPTSSAKAATAA